METENEIKVEYQDLLYFGYDWSDEAAQNRNAQTEFIKEIKERFPNAKLKNAYDNIKGFRQEVFLEEKDSDNYFAWAIAFGWSSASMTLTLLSMSAGDDEVHKKKIYKYLDLAKEQYPTHFKPEALKKE